MLLLIQFYELVNWLTDRPSAALLRVAKLIIVIFACIFPTAERQIDSSSTNEFRNQTRVVVTLCSNCTESCTEISSKFSDAHHDAPFNRFGVKVGRLGHFESKQVVWELSAMFLPVWIAIRDSQFAVIGNGEDALMTLTFLVTNRKVHECRHWFSISARLVAEPIDSVDKVKNE